MPEINTERTALVLDEATLAAIGTEQEQGKEEGAEGKPDIDTSQPAVSEIAQELGWNPNYDGPDKVDAKTFILRSRDIQKSLKDALHNNKREMSRMSKHIDELVADKRTEKGQQLSDKLELLKEERRAAIRESDVDRVEELDGQIAELAPKVPVQKKAEARPAAAQQVQGTDPNPLFTEWKEQNTWYGTDRRKSAVADAIAEEMDGEDPAEILAAVDAEIAKLYGGNGNGKTEPAAEPPQRKRASSSVEEPSRGGQAGGDQPGSITKADMDDNQRRNMRQAIESGGFKDEADYLREYNRTRSGR